PGGPGRRSNPPVPPPRGRLGPPPPRPPGQNPPEIAPGGPPAPPCPRGPVLDRQGCSPARVAGRFRAAARHTTAGSGRKGTEFRLRRNHAGVRLRTVPREEAGRKAA